MSISEVGQQLANILSQSSSLFLASGDSFAKDLMLGQVIKGKVLRSYEGGRYLVSFAGQEKTVDSAVPLKAGELVQGRVVSIGEKVEIKRLPMSAQESQGAVPNNESVTGFVNKWDALLIQAMRDYNIRFDAPQRADVIKTMKLAANPQHILLAAIAMNKQNIPISKELLLELGRLQAGHEKLSMFSVSQSVPRLDSNQESSMDTDINSLYLMSSLISKLVSEQSELAKKNFSEQVESAIEKENIETLDQSGAEADFSESEREFSDKWYLLNNQVNGAIQHRTITLPFWLGEKLIEVDIVAYEQRQQAMMPNEINTKKIIFSLQLDVLGHVEVEILMNNKNLKMSISSESSEGTHQLLSHGAELSNEIKNSDWNLDEMSYLTREVNEMGSVVSSVLQHYASQDSLSRLM